LVRFLRLSSLGGSTCSNRLQPGPGTSMGQPEPHREGGDFVEDCRGLATLAPEGLHYCGPSGRSSGVPRCSGPLEIPQKSMGLKAFLTRPPVRSPGVRPRPSRLFTSYPLTLAPVFTTCERHPLVSHVAVAGRLSPVTRFSHHRQTQRPRSPLRLFQTLVYAFAPI